MPNLRPGRLSTVTLVVFLRAAGCTSRVIRKAQEGRPRTKSHRPPSIWRQPAQPTAASTPRFRVTPTMNIEISSPPRRLCGQRRRRNAGLTSAC